MQKRNLIRSLSDPQDQYVFVSPGFKWIIHDHIFTSDLNVKSDLDIIDFEWSWDRISLKGFKLETLSPQWSFMEESGLTQPTLADLRTLKMESTRGPGLIFHYIYMVGYALYFLSLSTALCYGLYYYYVFYYFQKCAASAAPAPINNHYATVTSPPSC